MTVALVDEAPPSIRGIRPKRTVGPVVRSAPRRWRRRLLGALVIGYLLFCHGCHGDEDTELFTKMSTSSRANPRELVGSIIWDVGLQSETVAAATGHSVPI
jgi:hypothetical protein